MDKYTLPFGVANADIKYPNVILIPTDTDDASSATMRAGEAALSDRTRFLMNGLSWGRVRVEARSEGASIVLEKVGPIPIYDDVNDQWFLFRSPFPGTPITISTVGLIGNNSWNYLYAIQNAGVLDFQISTTPPDNLLIGKGGDTRFRYLLCFRSNGAATPVFFHLSRGVYYYYGNEPVAGPLSPTGIGDAASIISLATRVPPHVRTAYVYWKLLNNSLIAGEAISVRPNGIGSATVYTQSNNGYLNMTVWMPTDSQQRVQGWIISVLNSFLVSVLGFAEE